MESSDEFSDTEDVDFEIGEGHASEKDRLKKFFEKRCKCKISEDPIRTIKTKTKKCLHSFHINTKVI